MRGISPVPWPGSASAGRRRLRCGRSGGAAIPARAAAPL